jgi:chromosomal replication initiator protein
MSLSATEIWARILDRARQDFPEQTFRTWLEPTEAVSIDGDTIVVVAPDQFAADWNDSKHSDILSGYAPVALGHPLRVVFRVSEERKTRPQMDFFVAPVPKPVEPQAQQHSVVLANLNPRYTFDNFVVGKSNDMAYATTNAASHALGKAYNPIFLYGDTGLGKTHLMQAVAHDVYRRNANARITYVASEQFTNDLIASIQSRTTHEFRRRYRETDLLLVDDVQFLKGKESTQEEFFHTFNAYYEAGRQIILTSDRPPKEIPGLEARLVSRFEWGMVAHIGTPDLEHRVAILRQKSKLDNLELTIPEDVIEFIAEHVTSSVRELEGSLIKLLAYASLKHREISVEIAREALRDKLKASETSGATSAPVRVVSMETIQEAVAREWRVTTEGLKSKTRTKTLTVPRQVAMFLGRELLGMQLVEIGNAFGGRDHSTVIHSLERVNSEMAVDKDFADRVAKIRRMLESLRS